MEFLDTHLVSILNGFAIGALLFILAVGFSLIFGMMDVLNLAHGAVYLCGAYAAWRVTESSDGWGGFALALGAAALAGLVLGAGLAVLSAPLGRRGHLDQALLTLGIALIIGETLPAVFGEDVRSVTAPPGLDRSIDVLGHSYPAYRLALIGIGVALVLAVWLTFERTRLGALVRACVADRPMVETLGVDARKVTLGVFAVGSMLAAMAGVLGAPVYGARPGLDRTVLILGLVVVVIGGLGSVRGVLVGALVVGQVESLGRALLPDQASFLLFGALALVLALRPQGLFGAAGRAQ